ncbi:signal peptidase II [Paenibacillus nasutitermitis]|uniref:Lipoprotein signal peptidase n=1 Tax=Paenibacillus nasutitermitis TaxID=1652958 RepID=A0A916Z108_9BACL|nr:signal peptidase II [Paenibacillus nasutitermitis]GGD70839.1 lipoprotein signal peptidase [Paenibacillus nasutitermitis]
MKYYFYWIAVLVFVIDQVAKKLVEYNVAIGEKINVIGDGFFVITSIRNSGAAFGILQGQTLFFLIITLFVVGGVIWYIQRNRQTGTTLLLIGLGMVLGGAVGNFLDRALYGHVVDFLQFTFGPYIFPIFNLADSGIVCGVGLILLDAILSMKNENGDSNEHKKIKQDGHDGKQEHQPIQ